MDQNVEGMVQELLGLVGRTEGTPQWHTPKGPIYDSVVGTPAEARSNLLLLHLGGYLKS